MQKLSIFVPIFTLLLGPMQGCQACDEILIYSVTVDVIDDGGTSISDAMVSYSVDDGPEDLCVDIGGHGSFACGLDEAGAIAIFVQADGFAADEATLFIDDDGCHVAPEIMEMELQAE